MRSEGWSLTVRNWLIHRAFCTILWHIILVVVPVILSLKERCVKLPEPVMELESYKLRIPDPIHFLSGISGIDEYIVFPRFKNIVNTKGNAGCFILQELKFKRGVYGARRLGITLGIPADGWSPSPPATLAGRTSWRKNGLGGIITGDLQSEVLWQLESAVDLGKPAVICRRRLNGIIREDLGCKYVDIARKIPPGRDGVPSDQFQPADIA